MKVAPQTPIAVFLYNRPDHAERLFRSLSDCARLGECLVHIYCDAPRDYKAAPAVDATKKVAKHWASRLGAELVERASNLGCARSVVQETSRHCRDSGRVIVLEDDLMVHPRFVDYMLTGLDRYQDQERVLTICGFMFETDLPANDDAVFLPLTSSWGWATWQRAWRHFRWSPDPSSLGLDSKETRQRFNLRGTIDYAGLLESAIQGHGDIWDIYWYASAFANNGLGLFPRQSLVVNNGWDGSGLHCGDRPLYGLWPRYDPVWPTLSPSLRLPIEIETDASVYAAYVRFFREEERKSTHRFYRVTRVVKKLMRCLSPGPKHGEQSRRI